MPKSTESGTGLAARTAKVVRAQSHAANQLRKCDQAEPPWLVPRPTAKYTQRRTAMEMGNCRLCLAKAVELQNSHILPKWTYRRAFDKTAANGSANPIMMTSGVVVQTSEQAAEPMLCFACEQQLGRHEDYVSRLAYQAGGVLGLLTAVPALAVVEFYVERLRMTVRGANIAALDCQAISHFAASVFWRAHVARHPRVEGLRLWNPQAESLRRFIRGEAPLPPRMCVNLIAVVDGDTMTSVHSTTSVLPASGPRGENGVHFFVAAGLLFNLSTGTHAIPALCAACSGTPQVIFQDWRRIRFMAEAAVAMVSSPRRGRLARTPIE